MESLSTPAPVPSAALSELAASRLQAEEQARKERYARRNHRISRARSSKWKKSARTHQRRVRQNVRDLSFEHHSDEAMLLISSDPEALRRIGMGERSVADLEAVQQQIDYVEDQLWDRIQCLHGDSDEELHFEFESNDPTIIQLQAELKDLRLTIGLTELVEAYGEETLLRLHSQVEETDNSSQLSRHISSYKAAFQRMMLGEEAIKENLEAVTAEIPKKEKFLLSLLAPYRTDQLFDKINDKLIIKVQGELRSLMKDKAMLSELLALYSEDDIEHMAYRSMKWVRSRVSARKSQLLNSGGSIQLTQKRLDKLPQEERAMWKQTYQALKSKVTRLRLKRRRMDALAAHVEALEQLREETAALAAHMETLERLSAKRAA
jgi:hypothetical protein